MKAEITELFRYIHQWRLHYELTPDQFKEILWGVILCEHFGIQSPDKQMQIMVYSIPELEQAIKNIQAKLEPQ